LIQINIFEISSGKREKKGESIGQILLQPPPKEKQRGQFDDGQRKSSQRTGSRRSRQHYGAVGQSPVNGHPWLFASFNGEGVADTQRSHDIHTHIFRHELLWDP